MPLNTPSKPTPTKVQKPSTRPSSQGDGELLVRKRISRSTKIKIAILGIAVAAFIVYLILDVALKGPITSLLLNHDQLISAIESSGPFGPLLYICLQITQTVVAPIPGQIVGGVGGFLFGNWGILWTLIGSIIGCGIVFIIARHYGRPLLERIFKKSVVDKFDFILNAKSASLILFAIFLLPGFPDDVVCYIAGLTNVPIRRLMVLVTLGRLPTIVLTNFIGSGLNDNLPLVAVASVLGIIILGIGVWQRDRIMTWMKKTAGAPIEKIKEKDSSKKSEG